MSPTLTNPAEAQARAAAEADLTLTLPGGVPMYFRRIPAAPQGFLMGERGDRNAEPVHRVVVPNDFWLGIFPVTQAQYRAVATAWADPNVDAEPSYFSGDCRPVEEVTWSDAVAWCGVLRNHWGDVWVRAKCDASVHIERCGLPSEAQWEYSCRGVPGERDAMWSRASYSTGEGVARLEAAGWFGEDYMRGGTHEVGERGSNGFGLYDMHGNVWEWCEDVWDDRAYRRRQDGWHARGWTLEDALEGAYRLGRPRTPADHPDRVVRGGSWIDPAEHCRSASRRWGGVDDPNWNVGFRVCVQACVARPSQCAGDPGQSPGVDEQGARRPLA